MNKNLSVAVAALASSVSFPLAFADEGAGPQHFEIGLHSGASRSSFSGAYVMSPQIASSFRLGLEVAARRFDTVSATGDAESKNTSEYQLFFAGSQDIANNFLWKATGGLGSTRVTGRRVTDGPSDSRTENIVFSDFRFGVGQFVKFKNSEWGITWDAGVSLRNYYRGKKVLLVGGETPLPSIEPGAFVRFGVGM